MRAMILAAGLGTRVHPLSALRPKAAMPVRGIPLIAYPLHWLAAQGVEEATINLHALPHLLRAAAERYAPPSLSLAFSEEPRLLDTGGGIRHAARFLRESDPCVVIAADMLLDLELAPLVETHRAAGSAVTLVLRQDPRSTRFGTIGVDAAGHVRRIAGRLDLGSETHAGLYLSVTLLSPKAFDWMPECEAFGHLDAWFGTRLREGGDDVRGEFVDTALSVWEPVGTLLEYLAVNLAPPTLSCFDPEPRAVREGTSFEGDLVIGAGAEIDPGASLARAVIWEKEHVPAGLRAQDGVFAGGRFHACAEKNDGDGT